MHDKSHAIINSNKNVLPDKSAYFKINFLIYLYQYVVNTQKNLLTETILLSTQNI